MKAVVVTKFGGPEVLEWLDVPDRHPGPGQIRVRVHAATVNPSDILVRSGAAAALFDGALVPPFSPGNEAAGVIDGIGPSTDTDLKIGDRVMAFVVPYMSSGGAYAQHLILDPRQVALAPVGSSHAQAATLPSNGLTVIQAMDLLNPTAGEWLAVTGAAGAVGGYTIELAKALGLYVVADASPADEKLVRSLGADRVVARGPGVAERMLDAVPGGVSYIVDGALLGKVLFPAIRPGGQLVMGRRSDMPGVEPLNPHPDVIVHEVFVPEYVYEQRKLDSLRSHAEKHQLTMRIAAEYPAAEAADAHRHQQAGGVRGRIVLIL